MTDNRIRWKGHSSAISGTNYKIYHDVATPNDFAITPITQAATSPYAPAQAALSGAITDKATSLTMDSAASFSNGDYIKVDRETILLGGKTGQSFNSISRGQHNTVKQDHLDTSNIYKMHETYLHAGVSFGTRHVIRYRVTATIGGVELVAAEAVAVKPTLPSTNDKVTIWGLQDKLDGTPHAGITVSMSVEAKAYNPGTAETIDTESLSTTTDISGYWELITQRDVAKANGGAITITINNVPYQLTSIPDRDTVCFLECF